MPWFRKKKNHIEEQQRDKISSSQKMLLDAAISTADMAQFVTTRLKEGLEDAIKQFETTAAIMSDALVMSDTKGKMKACNPAASKIFGYETCEIMKKSALDLFLHHGGIIASPDELWQAAGPEVMQEMKDLIGIRKNGEEFPVEITMTKLGRADGSTIVLMLIKDMSDWIALKKEAEINTNRYHSLFELCFDGILVVQDGRIVAANQQAGRLFGVRAESLSNVEFTHLVNKEDREKLVNIHREPVTVSAVRPDGKPMALLFSGTDITWNDETTASLVTVRDLKW